MIDYICIALLLIVAFIGYKAGFSRVLIFVSNGVIGKIATFIVFYFTFGLVLALTFVQDFLALIVDKVNQVNNSILSFLVINLKLDVVLFGIIFWLLITLARKFLVRLISKFFAIQTGAIIVVNKILGVIFAILWFLVIALILMQILAWTTGVEGSVYQYLENSFLGLGWVFKNNPINSMISVFNANFLSNR